MATSLSLLKEFLSELAAQKQIVLNYVEEDVDDISTKTIQLEDDPDKQNQMAGNARRLYEQKLAAENVYSAFSERLEKTVKGK